MLLVYQDLIMSFCSTLRLPALSSAPNTSYEDMFENSARRIFEDADENRIPEYTERYVKNTFDWYKETHYQIKGIWFCGSERVSSEISLPEGFAIATPLPAGYYGVLTGELNNEGWKIY